jgi:hypothetical protein
MMAEWPLVHPDQCQMMLRKADGLFFAEETAAAKLQYQTLFERLRFVPQLQRLLQTSPPKSGVTAVPQSQSLMYALYNMEAQLELSVWTFDSLFQIYQVVRTRLTQIMLGFDMFNLAPTWAPRQSFDFYYNNSKSLLEILKQFEGSYWDFLDAYQTQSKTISGAKEALVANVYRTKQIQDDIDRAWKAITTKESEIAQGATELNSKRSEVVTALKSAEAEFEHWHAPSAGSIFSAFTSLVIGVVGIATAAATGGVSLLATLGSVGSIGGVIEEAATTTSDAGGQRVNNKLVLNQLRTCEDDLNSLFKTAASLQPDGSLLVDADDTKKIVATEGQIRSFIKQFKDKVPDSVKETLDSFLQLSTTRNANIVTYNNAISTLYERLSSKRVAEKQASEIGSVLIRENKCIPSILAYYQRLRMDLRLTILRGIKQSALALRFWGLLKLAKFSSSGGLLASLDELYAHMRVLLQAYEASAVRYSDFSQSTWPRNPAIGILYRLNPIELKALKIRQNDAFSRSEGGVHTTMIKSLLNAARRDTNFRQSPFAGHSNVRLTTVRFWAPGLRFQTIEDGMALKVPDPSFNTVVVEAGRKVSIDIQHQGKESIVDPDDTVHGFEHTMTLITSQYDPRLVNSMNDVANAAWTWEAMGSDWTSNNANAKILAPIGPFAEWRVAIRTDICGELDWTNVSQAYLEFCGSSFPFRR